MPSFLAAFPVVAYTSSSLGDLRNRHGSCPYNPAREVKTEKFSRTEGKTPDFDTEQVQKVLDRIETSNEAAFAIALC
jgi:hypothetical protein